MFKRTTAINKILALKEPTRVIPGGTSSGKTHGIIPVLIDRAAREKLKITVVNETIPAAKDGPVEIFKTVMQETNRWIESHWIRNPLEYTFGNGSKIQFKSFDSVGKAKASGKRDILFINEANHIPYKVAEALMIRSNEVYIDYNPDNEFWVDEVVLNEPDVDFLRLTYHDNEAIPPQLLKKILQKTNLAFFDPDGDWKDPKNVKSEYWANWCRVYILGEIGKLEGVVFDNWEEIEQIPPDAKLVSLVLDWGYSNDPTALVAIYKWNQHYILDEEIYEVGLTNREIANLVKSKGLQRHQIIADSAEPKSIKELNRLGLKVRPAQKGKDSIMFGIDKMQEQSFLVTKRSINIKDEFRRYKWAKDKIGNVLNKPIDSFNHAIDAIRYFFTSKPKAKAPKAQIIE
jgi:phage terminase large subunit